MENLKISNCQPKLYVVVGCPASGKSTWVRNQIEKNGGRHVSRDRIRYDLVGDGKYFSKEKQVFRHFCQEILEGLEKGEDVYADATHINKSSRAKLMNQIGATVGLMKVEVIAVVIDTSLEICMERNSKRTGFALVPDDVVRNVYKFKSKPREEEGYFDKIITVKGE